MDDLKLNIYGLLEKIRQEAPLVHHITNWVTIYDCANIVKALGGSPVMAHAREEAEQMAGLASALVLNIGTLTPELVEAMEIAGCRANRKGIPVILDACGAGATDLRDRCCLRLLDRVKIDIIKGNASEIARLAGEDVQTRGVDSGGVNKDISSVAGYLAGKHGAVVAVTGKEDVVRGAGEFYLVANGHPMLATIVGSGCMATSVIAVFAAVEPRLARAAAAGLSCFGIAAECAAAQSKGPGSFKAALFDCLAGLDKDTLEQRQRIR